MNLGSNVAMNRLLLREIPCERAATNHNSAWSYRSFLANRHLMNMVFCSLLQQNCQEKYKYQAQGWQSPTSWGHGQLDRFEFAQIQEYFTRKPMTRVPHPVYSSDLSPSDFSFFGCAKTNDRLSNHRVGPPEGKLTEVEESRHFRPPSISVRQVEGRIGICHGTRGRILS
jgi:hypothetical protein